MSNNTSLCFPFNKYQINAPFSGEIIVDEDKVKDIKFEFLQTETYKSGMWNGSGYQEILINFQKLSSQYSIFNTEAFCRAAEEISEIEISANTKRIRLIFNEIARINNHLLILADIADLLSMDILCGEILRQKDKISTLFFELFGNRIFANVNSIGDTLKITRQMILKINVIIKSIDDYFKGINELFHEDSAMKEALSGIGVLKGHKASILGLTGPAAKASGIGYDLRKESYEAFSQEFSPITYTSGDCYARTLVRAEEIAQSIFLIFEMIQNITPESISPDDESIKLPVCRSGEKLMRFEQSEGISELYIKLGNDGIVCELTLNNYREKALQAMESALVGADILDVPMIMATFNYGDRGMEVY